MLVKMIHLLNGVSQTRAAGNVADVLLVLFTWLYCMFRVFHDECCDKGSLGHVLVYLCM